jgi:hypothetical protein
MIVGKITSAAIDAKLTCRHNITNTMFIYFTGYSDNAHKTTICFKSTNFWDMRTCSNVKAYQYFRRT